MAHNPNQPNLFGDEPVASPVPVDLDEIASKIAERSRDPEIRALNQDAYSRDAEREGLGAHKAYLESKQAENLAKEARRWGPTEAEKEAGLPGVAEARRMLDQQSKE